MSTTESIDPYLVTAIKLLHSSAPDSAEKLRIMLDNEISKNHDKSKLITSLLTKKQLNDEKSAPGSGYKKHKPKKAEEIKLPVRAISTPDPEVIPILDDDESDTDKKSEIDDEMDYSDFTCVTCRQIDSSANNQLFECIECHLLHHQLCHIPKISSECNIGTWVCSSCKGKKEKEGSTKSTKSYESSSSSSSNSSNRKLTISTKASPAPEKKAEAPKRKGKESSSSSSSRSRSSKK